ncbi:hypothetical protein RB195_026241 [Necator americanus]|uniref:Uncharacterized protein n=1 Tax=Necator americanus TaxID=51031 RepID=A0ABR1EWI0_NECAM
MSNLPRKLNKINERVAVRVRSMSYPERARIMLSSAVKVEEKKMKIASKLNVFSAFDKDRPHILSNVNGRKLHDANNHESNKMFGIIVKTFDAFCNLIRRYHCFGSHHDVSDHFLEQGIGVYRNTVICADWECNFERPEHWKPKTSTPLLCVTVD